jgi:hypothetical protein
MMSWATFPANLHSRPPPTTTAAIVKRIFHNIWNTMYQLTKQNQQRRLQPVVHPPCMDMDTFRTPTFVRDKRRCAWLQIGRSSPKSVFHNPIEQLAIIIVYRSQPIADPQGRHTKPEYKIGSLVAEMTLDKYTV